MRHGVCRRFIESARDEQRGDRQPRTHTFLPQTSVEVGVRMLPIVSDALQRKADILAANFSRVENPVPVVDRY